MSNLDARTAVRTALSIEDMLAAAFGSTDFYAVNAAMYPEGLCLVHDGGNGGRYNVADPEKAKALLKKAGYDGKPLRILTSRQYEFHYKMAQVAAEYLKQAGFAVDLQVVDWATLTQRRDRAGAVGHLHHPQPVPARAGAHRPLGRERPGLVVDAGTEGGGRRLQRRDRPAEARRALGRRAEGDLRRDAEHQDRRLQRARRAVAEARAASAGAVAVLLERLSQVTP